ncbi:hypothetical protein CWI39_2699p0010, partial [Hamiltosporidium magnivora]
MKTNFLLYSVINIIGLFSGKIRCGSFSGDAGALVGGNNNFSLNVTNNNTSNELLAGAAKLSGEIGLGADVGSNLCAGLGGNLGAYVGSNLGAGLGRNLGA